MTLQEFLQYPVVSEFFDQPDQWYCQAKVYHLLKDSQIETLEGYCSELSGVNSVNYKKLSGMIRNVIEAKLLKHQEV